MQRVRTGSRLVPHFALLIANFAFWIELSPPHFHDRGPALSTPWSTTVRDTPPVRRRRRGQSRPARAPGMTGAKVMDSGTRGEGSKSIEALELNRETIQDLSESEAEHAAGGDGVAVTYYQTCQTCQCTQPASQGYVCQVQPTRVVSWGR